MISSLTGTISYHGLGYVIIDVAGVGYRVTLPEHIAHGLSGCITIFTHDAQRDDGRELFGFTHIKGLELCWRLIEVSGVGPKMAQKIIYGARDIDEAAQKIDTGDVEFLSGIPGVGKKTAQKIILELQGKLVAAPGSQVDEDALTALMGLGYTKMAAEAALSGLDRDLSTDEKIRAALKGLGR
jgi:Holliday junction DNA helicase RuvA